MKKLLLIVVASLLVTGCALLQVKHSPRAVVTRVDVTPPRPEIVITDPVQLEKLVSFFPSLRDEKKSDLYGAWEAKYYITFQFEDGSRIKVSTSYDDEDWSSGTGDKSLKPGLSGFLDPMFKKE